MAVGYWLSTWGSNWVHKIVLVQVMAQMAVSSHSFWHLGHFIDFLRLVQSLAQQPVKFNRLILIGLIKAKKGPQSYLQKTVTPLGNWLAWIRAHHTSQSAHPPSKSVKLKNVKKKSLVLVSDANPKTVFVSHPPTSRPGPENNFTPCKQTSYISSGYLIQVFIWC